MFDADADAAQRSFRRGPAPSRRRSPPCDSTTSITDALDELERVLPETAFRESLLAGLRRAYAPGTGMADAFGRWLEEVLGDRGLVVYDSSDPASKPLVSERVRARAVECRATR